MYRSIPDLLRHAADQYGNREFLRFPTPTPSTSTPTTPDHPTAHRPTTDRLTPEPTAVEVLTRVGVSLSFADVHELSGRLAGALVDKGIRPGDRVAVMMDNRPGWPVSWLAILRAGAITVPVNVRYRAADLDHILTDSRAVATLTTREHAAEIPGTVYCLEDLDLTAQPPEISPSPNDVANFQYTSGTTGFPKACMLTHDYWLRCAQLTADVVKPRPDDVMMIAQAYSYMDPQWIMIMCLVSGIPQVVLPRFSASGFWASAREHRATLTYVLGTMPMLMHKQPEHPQDRQNSMRLVLCSGISPALHATFEERWGAPWRELYGSTESGPDLLVSPDAAETVGTGAMGFPPPDKEVRVLAPDGEVGEIVVRGAPMMKGYWNHPEATAHVFRAGWYHTGDLGFRDPEGYIHHAGRLTDMVRRGGENISCAEVENVLSQHPAVLAAALVPIEDELFGELPKAFVQLRPGHAADAQTAHAIAEHARQRLARFKVPAYIEFVEEFTLTPSARIEKRHLRQPNRDQRTNAIHVEESP